MSRKVLVGLCAALAVFAFGVMTVGSASGANMKIKGNSPGFLAIYGNPGSNGEAIPVGGGLGRNFGFGQNMLFKAGGGIGKPLAFTLPSGVESKACDSWIGGVLMSNKTGANNPLSFGIEFADFQCSKLNTGARLSVYADTQDQKWIAEICAPATPKCRVEPLNNQETLGGEENVKIEHVAINVGPGIVLQGAVWGKWKNGKPPCIQLQNKPEKAPADQTLMVTQTSNEAVAAVGESVKSVEGEACLYSANNDWVTQSEKTEPEIEIANE